MLPKLYSAQEAVDLITSIRKILYLAASEAYLIEKPDKYHYPPYSLTFG